jgi:hypothetical protein
MSNDGRSKQGEYGSYMQCPHRTLHRIHFDQRDDRQKKFQLNFTIVHQQVMYARVSPGGANILAKAKRRQRRHRNRPERSELSAPRVETRECLRRHV